MQDTQYSRDYTRIQDYTRASINLGTALKLEQGLHQEKTVKLEQGLHQDT